MTFAEKPASARNFRGPRPEGTATGGLRGSRVEAEKDWGGRLQLTPQTHPRRDLLTACGAAAHVAVYGVCWTNLLCQVLRLARGGHGYQTTVSLVKALVSPALLIYALESDRCGTPTRGAAAGAISLLLLYDCATQKG
ncbi:unnamed protein product [Prorocentrum cordatum]|uniref:Sugar phosphate transporter domain-containing protein n=1 Tax=Prorocentrum cordatum TaxID=2364126 RepID=A0ABN9W1D8_9DINO|nr:unnamed protein product [Polarella glacialis]